MNNIASNPIVIVGGGLSGLTAAASLALAGLPVVLFEKAAATGGRASTQAIDGFHLNLGPHALYERGAAVKGLKALGVPINAAARGANGGFAIVDGVRHTLPAGFCSLLTTGLFGLGAKIETARLLGQIRSLDTSALHSVAVADWLRGRLRDPDATEFFLALVRLTTYANDPERHSAGAAIEQLKLSLTGRVLYVHHGWGTLIASLRAIAGAAGAVISNSTRVVALDSDQNLRVRNVRLGDGSQIPCRAVIIATSPADAKHLVSPLHLLGVAPQPIRLATLDLALQRLPCPRRTLALGIHEPVYFSVHSSVAQLAPPGGAVVHVAKYLRAGRMGTTDDERELEAVMDLMQPAWRDEIVHRRFLPALVVSNALPTAREGGMLGRPDGRVDPVENLFLAGDWVGREGQLADAAVSSALQAAAAIRRFLAASEPDARPRMAAQLA